MRAPAEVPEVECASRYSGQRPLTDSQMMSLADWAGSVRYDHMEGERLRHIAQFNGGRPDRAPRSCTYDTRTTHSPSASVTSFPALAERTAQVCAAWILFAALIPATTADSCPEVAK